MKTLPMRGSILAGGRREVNGGGSLEVVLLRRFIDLHRLVPGKLGLLDFDRVRLDDALLHRIAGGGIDRMRDVGVQLDAGLRIGGGLRRQPAAAVVAEFRTQMVLAAAAGASVA